MTATRMPSAAHSAAGGIPHAGGRTVLAVDGVSKAFKGIQALDSVNLEVNTGEIVVLLGPSGCGKTTLLRAIAGLATIDSGSIVLDGSSIVDQAPESRDIAMVFQDAALFPHLSVGKNIRAGLRARHDDRLIGETAELLRITPLLNRRPHELSGGQRQRVGIARALVRRPHLMLMDEPFAALDAELRLELRRELRSLHTSGDLAETIFVTHDQTEALGIADRIVVMSEGRVLQTGTPTELLDGPQTLDVAQFLGVPRISVLPVIDGVVLGIRPTDLAIADHAHESHTGRLTITGREPFAGGWLVTGRLPGGALIDVVTPWSFVGQAGDTIDIVPVWDRVHFFDAKTRQRISVSHHQAIEYWQGATR